MYRTDKYSQHSSVICGYSMSTIWVFDNIENKQTLCRGEVCMKMFCQFLREQTKSITAFEKKKMTLLTKEELKSHQDAKLCYICRKRILKKIAKNKNYQKVRYYCYYTGKYRAAAHSICNLKFHVLNGTPAVFRSGSN